MAIKTRSTLVVSFAVVLAFGVCLALFAPSSEIRAIAWKAIFPSNLRLNLMIFAAISPLCIAWGIYRGLRKRKKVQAEKSSTSASTPLVPHA
jgi:hypothetical protein